MAKLRTRKWLLSAVASLTCLLAVGFYALAQAPDEGKRDRKVAVPGGTFHVLPATLETTQWGWLDPAEPPKLVVNSGDTVAVETMMHAHNKVQPGTTMLILDSFHLGWRGGLWNSSMCEKNASTNRATRS